MRLIKMKIIEWLYPEEVEKNSKWKFYNLKSNKKKVILGPSESMSKSKKNIIDPEEMINIYGADSIRWFMLWQIARPKEMCNGRKKEYQQAFKFIQKLWTLNNEILNKKDSDRRY